MISQDQVIERAAGVFGVLVGFVQLLELMPPAQFEIFWECSLQDNEELWNDFSHRRDASDNASFGWADYALKVLNENMSRYLRPKSCQLGGLGDMVATMAIQKLVCAGQTMTDTELLSAHREEEPALGKWQRYLCKGCNMSECPVYPKNQKGRRDRW